MRSCSLTSWSTAAFTEVLLASCFAMLVIAVNAALTGLENAGSAVKTTVRPVALPVARPAARPAVRDDAAAILTTVRFITHFSSSFSTSDNTPRRVLHLRDG